MALTAVSVTAAATTVAAAPAGTTNTITVADIGTNGVLLNVINGSGAAVTATIADPTLSLAGNPGTPTGQSIPAGADRWLRVSPVHVDQTTGVATVTLSAAASVTYKLVRC